MKIKYLGHSSFKITGKTSTHEKVTIVTDPFDKKSVGINYPKQNADILTISHFHDDHNAVDNVSGTVEGEDAFLIDTPGEYEVKGLRIYGYNSFHDDKKGAERGKNTIYVYDFVDCRVAHLGDLGHKLDSEVLEHLENIDILMVPTGGVFTIDPKIAVNVVESIEPTVVIPMHFKTPQHNDTFKELAGIEAFTSELGAIVEESDTLNVKSHNELPNDLTVIKLSF